jgi:CheY-like chemotaxis protein
LPVARPDETRAHQGEAPSAAILIPPGGRILVVDDEASLAQLLRRVLESHGYTVATCTSANEALHLFDPAAFDLVISDYAMPGGDGLELAAALHARSPSTPIVLMTAWGSGLDLRSLPVEIAGVVSKPYRLSEVIEAVDAALAQRGRPA